MGQEFEQVAVRVNMEKDEDIALLNAYLSKGYYVVNQSDVSQRLIDKKNNTIYFSTLIYILQKNL